MYKRQGNRILNLVVAGLILQAVATSLMMMMKLYADPATQLANMEYWLMGGFSDASWSAVLLTLVLCTLGMSGLYLLRWQIQLLSFGEEASTLGAVSYTHLDVYKGQVWDWRWYRRLRSCIMAI